MLVKNVTRYISILVALSILTSGTQSCMNSFPSGKATKTPEPQAKKGVDLPKNGNLFPAPQRKHSKSAESKPTTLAVKEVIMIGRNKEPVQAAIQKGLDISTKYLENRFNNTEFSARWTSENKPEFGILTVQPIYESKTLRHTVFGQGSMFHRGSRTTLNLGTGYRRLTLNEKVLAGINAFYDHEFPYDHKRMSIGGEIRTTVGELNINFYRAISNWIAGRSGVDERALDGYDLELGLPFPHMPAITGYAKRFKWNSFDGRSDITGTTYSLKSTMGGINVEGGIRDYNSLNTERFFEVSVNVINLLQNQKKKPFISEKAYELASMKDHRLEKVRRENFILKQTRGALTIVTR